MSRYAFDEIFNTSNSNAEDLDSAGFSLQNWIDYGVIGWDNGLESYFIQLDMDEDTPKWWFGTSFREIVSVYAVRELLARLFMVNSFEMTNSGLESLIQDRKNGVQDKRYLLPDAKKEILNAFLVADESWLSGALNRNSFLSGYISAAEGFSE